MRILTAHDLTPGSANALRRSAALITEAGSELRVIHAIPATAGEDAAFAARERLAAALRGVTDRDLGSESALSMRICHAKPGDAILGQAKAFDPDLIVLGAHGEPRLRDAIFGTTAGHVIREAEPPVLIVQNDPDRRYRKMLVAVDDETAERVLDLALAFAAPDEVYIVHAFGSVAEALAGAGDLLEEARTDQEVLAAGLRRKLAGSGRPTPRIETIVAEGDPLDLIMRAWIRVRPDLVVLGTHGRTGIAHLLHGSVAETALLGCPTDMLIMRTSGPA